MLCYQDNGAASLSHPGSTPRGFLSDGRKKVTRVKNIIIWALVIAKAFFLAFFLGRIIKENSEKKETLENLSALFGRNGIHLDAGNIREGGELAELHISRDIARERRLAENAPRSG
jgi:hypothetical protein